MISFWDRVWAVTALSIRDYYKEREEQRKRWSDFCQNCTQEILDECIKIANIVGDTTSKQSGSHVHKDLVDGIVQLPMYGFYLVLRMQKGIVQEQSHVLQLFFSHFRIPYTMNLFLEATRTDNHTRQSLINLVGISEETAGAFWVQFFKVLYRTDEDTTYISKLIESFCAITMRFSALTGEPEDALLPVLEQFLKDVHTQAVLCRQIPADDVDFYGDAPFIEHYEKYKEDAYKVCNMTMDENDDDLNPRGFFTSFTLGIIYQVVKRSTRNRPDKIMIIDDILSQIDTDTDVDGEYIFKYMEDLQGEETSMLAAMMHIFTDLEKGNPVGWVMLARGSGTYNLKTGKDINAIQEAINFIIGMENYLVDKYPMSGFGHIASGYARDVVDIINDDIDKNVEIVDTSSVDRDSSTGIHSVSDEKRKSSTQPNSVQATTMDIMNREMPEGRGSFFARLFKR